MKNGGTCVDFEDLLDHPDESHPAHEVTVRCYNLVGQDQRIDDRCRGPDSLHGTPSQGDVMGLGMSWTSFDVYGIGSEIYLPHDYPASMGESYCIT